MKLQADSGRSRRSLAGCARKPPKSGAISNGNTRNHRYLGGRPVPRRSKADLDTPPVRLIAPAVPADLPPAPEHLSAAMQAWWNDVVTDYDLDQHHLRLLEAACDSWDEMVAARQLLREEGYTVATRDGGKKKHPAADIERDARLSFARLLRELDLDAEPPAERPAWRPPALRSNRRR